MITDIRISLTAEFTMNSSTDYLAIIDATRYLVGMARRCDIDVDRCSLTTSASSGYGSVGMHHDQSLDSPAVSATAGGADR